jgi:hypothetical protein
VAEVRDNHQEVIGDEPRDYDVFISHASPDKDEIVRPLATRLREGGLVRRVSRCGWATACVDASTRVSAARA